MIEDLLQIILPLAIFIFGYITNGCSFPQPLSKEEEAILIEKSKAGDLEARNILIERNLRLVAHVIKKYKSVGIDQEDLISIGTIGLIKAVSTFDEKRHTARHLCRQMHDNEVLMTIRSEKLKRSIPPGPWGQTRKAIIFILLT